MGACARAKPAAMNGARFVLLLSLWPRAPVIVEAPVMPTPPPVEDQVAEVVIPSEIEFDPSLMS